MIVFTANVFINNFKVLLLTFTHYGVTILSIILSIIAYFIAFLIESELPSFEGFNYMERIFVELKIYFVLILIVFISTGIDLGV